MLSPLLIARLQKQLSACPWRLRVFSQRSEWSCFSAVIVLTWMLVHYKKFWEILSSQYTCKIIYSSATYPHKQTWTRPSCLRSPCYAKPKPEGHKKLQILNKYEISCHSDVIWAGVTCYRPALTIFLNLALLSLRQDSLFNETNLYFCLYGPFKCG